MYPFFNFVNSPDFLPCALYFHLHFMTFMIYDTLFAVNAAFYVLTYWTGLDYVFCFWLLAFSLMYSSTHRSMWENNTNDFWCHLLQSMLFASLKLSRQHSLIDKTLLPCVNPSHSNPKTQPHLDAVLNNPDSLDRILYLHVLSLSARGDVISFSRIYHHYSAILVIFQCCTT